MGDSNSVVFSLITVYCLLITEKKLPNSPIPQIMAKS